MKKILILFTAVMFAGTGCNDWLEVRPETQVRQDEMFDSYKGFRDALTGCYIKMNDRNLYGEYLTMSAVESLAQLWVVSETSTPTLYYLGRFDYENSYSRTAIESIYSSMYNVIVQANDIIKNMEVNGEVITDPAKRAIIYAEALAIRAFCHLDILRLFGQVPNNATIQVSLPYSYDVSRESVKYYTYSEFIANIEKDLIAAEQSLFENDPLFDYTFSQLSANSTAYVNDTYLTYRQLRFNYYAVKGLQARFYLYTSQNPKAYAAAKTILDARGPGGEPVLMIGEYLKNETTTDYAMGAYQLPSESLMALNNIEMQSYLSALLGLKLTEAVQRRHLHITMSMFSRLFSNTTPANYRYEYTWDRTSYSYQGNATVPTLLKYWNDSDAAIEDIYRVIPLIRLSEIYLIAIETTSDLNEAQTLYKNWHISQGSLPNVVFSTLAEIPEWLIDDYRREFYGEGQMFYTYKRHGSTTMYGNTFDVSGNVIDVEVTEPNYILPLPATEYNPNN